MICLFVNGRNSYHTKSHLPKSQHRWNRNNLKALSHWYKLLAANSSRVHSSMKFTQHSRLWKKEIKLWKHNIPTLIMNIEEIVYFKKILARQQKITDFAVTCRSNASYSPILAVSKWHLTRMWADAQRDGHPPNMGGVLCESFVIPRHKV